jgi:hypothetical protein
LVDGVTLECLFYGASAFDFGDIERVFVGGFDEVAPLFEGHIAIGFEAEGVLFGAGESDWKGGRFFESQQGGNESQAGLCENGVMGCSVFCGERG